MAIHQFDAGSSGDHDLHDCWALFYRRGFAGYVTHDVVTDKTLQKAGIDHRVHLDGGGEILVDVKCRCQSTTWRDDVLIEVWSDKGRKVPGWARKALRSHYVAYGWPQYGVAYLVPFLLLRRAYERNKHKWAKDGLTVVTAKNTTYDTVSVAVPYARLLQEVSEAMTVYASDDMEPFVA